jgi:cystathionine beta-lyase/cystathionine gamma-synthase
MPFSMRLRSSALATPGAVMKASRSRQPQSDRTIALPPKEGPVIRLQIGLEDVEDLMADIERGLEAAKAA